MDETKPYEQSMSQPTLLLITAIMMTVSILPALDMTVANVALPHMQGAISASREQIAWVLTSYAVATAIAMPFAGWLAERFGRSQVMRWSVAGFTLASAFCGLSDSLLQIIASRLLQGASGAALIPLAQAVIIESYPVNKVRRGLAIWGSGTMIAPIIGPTLGGLLADTAGWQWIFFINIPIGLISLLAMHSHIPRNKPKPERRLDFFGFASLAIAIGALQALLDRGQHLDWFDSVEIRIEACVAIAALCYFVVHTLTAHSTTFFDKRLLSDRNYSTGLVGMAIGGGILSSTRALLPLMLQGIFFYSAYDAGVVMGPSGLGSVLAIAAFAQWERRIDSRAFIITGLLLVALSLWMLIGVNLDTTAMDIALPNLVQGAGMVLFMSPLSALAFTTLPHHLLNEGGTIFYLARNIGGSFAIAITQTILSRSGAVMHANLAEHITAYDTRLATLPVSPELAATVLNEEITRQASMVAYLDAFLLLLAAILASSALLLLLRPQRQSRDLPSNMVLE